MVAHFVDDQTRQTPVSDRDPLLSPGFASRADGPQPVFFVASLDDSMCDEAAVLVRKLAGSKDWGARRDGVVGVGWGAR
jgi:hypothetical protein